MGTRVASPPPGDPGYTGSPQRKPQPPPAPPRATVPPHRFLRLQWSATEAMSAALQGELQPGERVVAMSATDNEVLFLLVRELSS